MSSQAPFLLFGPAFKADPYPTYARLREQQPVYCRTSADGHSRMWFITRYEDVAAALRDTRRYVKDVRNALAAEQLAALRPEPELYRLLSHHMLNADGAEHARLRNLVNLAFTTRMVEQLEPRVQAVVDAHVDKVQARGHMELIEDFSLPFAIQVIAGMLGLPDCDHRRYRAWSHALVAPSADSERSRHKTERLRHVMEDFVTYLRRLCAERRRAPQPDLISSLLQAETAGDRLSEEELLSMLLLLVVVGHETSIYLIGNAILTLLHHPATLHQLIARPTLIQQAVEELIRYDGPVERATMRFAAEDITLYGQTISRGDAVTLVLASAHRDPAAFDEPGTFDIERSNNRHLGFGQGVHYCLGAPLARLEARVAIGTLLRRLPYLRLAVPPEELRWHTNPILRGQRSCRYVGHHRAAP